MIELVFASAHSDCSRATDNSEVFMPVGRARSALGCQFCETVEKPRSRTLPKLPKPLQKNEGEPRTRRPRQGVASPASEFLLKIGPKTGGSKHLLVSTEEIPPGAPIPKHKHHGEDEILLIHTASAHVWLGDKKYDAQAGAFVFTPAETWISLKNASKESISLVSIWNEPGFEEMLRCGSVPKGQMAPPLSREGVKECYHHVRTRPRLESSQEMTRAHLPGVHQRIWRRLWILDEQRFDNPIREDWPTVRPNTGPYGDATMNQLIPAIERRFRISPPTYER
jgi:quercetin dioxygenase-like cupin family protein